MGQSACRQPRSLNQAAMTYLAHKLVDVVVETVVYAVDVVQPSAPACPQPIADPALPEGCHARRGGPVGGIVSVEGVREVGVLNLDRVAASGYCREYVLVLTDGSKGRVVLDAAQRVRYTGGVHKSLLMGRAPGCSRTAGAISLSDAISIQYCMIIIY